MIYTIKLNEFLKQKKDSSQLFVTKNKGKLFGARIFFDFFPLEITFVK